MKCPFHKKCPFYKLPGFIKDKDGNLQKINVCCNDSVESVFCGKYKELKREAHGFKND